MDVCSRRYCKDDDQLTMAAFFRCPDKELRALLFFLLVHCGSADGLAVYEGFHNQLEKAFSCHIGHKKAINGSTQVQSNTLAAATSANRPRDETGSFDVHSRRYHFTSTPIY
jgi:hypothetical protein